jgi:hypothetical protein
MTTTLARTTTDFGQRSSKPSYLVGVTQTDYQHEFGPHYCHFPSVTSKRVTYSHYHCVFVSVFLTLVLNGYVFCQTSSHQFVVSKGNVTRFVCLTSV